MFTRKLLKPDSAISGCDCVYVEPLSQDKEIYTPHRKNQRQIMRTTRPSGHPGGGGEDVCPIGLCLPKGAVSAQRGVPAQGGVFLGCLPKGCTPRPRGRQSPSTQRQTQTSVKPLPCPKLRLRAVKMFKQLLLKWSDMELFPSMNKNSTHVVEHTSFCKKKTFTCFSLQNAIASCDHCIIV